LENIGTLDVELSKKDVEEVRKVANAADATHGSRYTDGMGVHLIFVDMHELK
jgi:hypothetical protein